MTHESLNCEINISFSNAAYSYVQVKQTFSPPIYQAQLFFCHSDGNFGNFGEVFGKGKECFLLNISFFFLSISIYHPLVLVKNKKSNSWNFFIL